MKAQTTTKDRTREEILNKVAEGYPYTVKQLYFSMPFGVSKDTIRACLRELLSKGLVEQDPTQRIPTYWKPGANKCFHLHTEDWTCEECGEKLGTICQDCNEELPLANQAAFHQPGCSHFALVIDKKDRGWKMEAIRSRLATGKIVTRLSLARKVKSNERNVHIMISKINEKGEGPHISYNRSTQSYQIAAQA